MDSSAQYQAIPIGTGEVTSELQNERILRFRSLMHLTHPKALVLATAIICITFATVHFSNHTLRSGTERAHRSLVQKSVNIAPELTQTSRRSYTCKDLTQEVWLCHYAPAEFLIMCMECGLVPKPNQRNAVNGMNRVFGSKQTVGGVTIAPGPVEKYRFSCDELKKHPDWCGMTYDHALMADCYACGTGSAPGSQRTSTAPSFAQTSRAQSCDVLSKNLRWCYNMYDRWTNVRCAECGLL